MFFSLGIFNFRSLVKTTSVFFLFLLGIFIQGTLIHSRFPDLIVPDFTVLIVLYLGLRCQNIKGLLGAFFLGLLFDFSSATYLGPHAAGCVVAFCVTGVIAKRVFAEKAFAIMSIAFWGCLFKSATYALLLVVYVSSDLFSFNSLQRVVLEAVFTALIAPLVLGFFIPKQSTSRFSSAASFRSTKRA